MLTSIYMVMPVGRPSLKHALFGGIVAAVLWEITRHVLVWYFATLSQVSVVYGSLTMAIVILFSLEWLATLLLFGAQVISQYERFGLEPAGAKRRAAQTIRAHHFFGRRTIPLSICIGYWCPDRK